MKQKYCLIQDATKHWFALPIELKDMFKCLSANVDDDLSEIFARFLLEEPISSYCFTKIKRIKDL